MTDPKITEELDAADDAESVDVEDGILEEDHGDEPEFGPISGIEDEDGEP